jgi:hypothetical protein
MDSNTHSVGAPAGFSALVAELQGLAAQDVGGLADGALTEGTISPAHAQVLASGTRDLPAHVAAEAEPVLVAAARRLDPSRLRRVVAQLRGVADPDGAGAQAQRRHRQRGVWLASTWEGMVAVNGLLEPEAGQTLVAALEPLARPTTTDDPRSGGQRAPTPSLNSPAATWKPVGCPGAAGCDPS